MPINRPLLLLAALGAAVGVAVMPRMARRDAAEAQTRSRAAERISEVQGEAVLPSDEHRTLRLSGVLKSGSEATLSSKLGGRVLAVLVLEGDPVRKGQALVRLDGGDQREQAAQALSGLQVARASLQKAREGERLKRTEIENRVSQAREGVALAILRVKRAEAGGRIQAGAGSAELARAEAGLDAAKGNLARVRAGATATQREQADLGVRQAERSLNTAKKNLDDVEFLYQKGGVSRFQFEEARTGWLRALDGVRQAQLQRQAVLDGASAEEITAAEAQVRQADAGIAAARAGLRREEVDAADAASARGQQRQAELDLKAAEAGRAELNLLKADIRAAEAAVKQAEAAVRLADRQTTEATITSPIDGVARSVMAHVGELAGPGLPLLRVVGTADTYLEAAVPARSLGELAAGQTAKVSADALPRRAFPGRIRSISRVAGPDGRSFPVRIDITGPADLLSPGGLGRAEVQTAAAESSVSVPIEAVRLDGAHASVWVVRGGVVTDVAVETRGQNATRARVTGELRPGEWVITAAPPGVTPGERVSIRGAR